jgi:hypothetical protein
VRPHRDFWLWLGGLFLTLFAFFAAVAIAYFLKNSNYSLFLNGWMLVALLSLVAAHASFFGALRSWPLPPPARSPRSAFPALEIDIHGASTIETQREADSGLAVAARLRSYTVTLRNAEIAQPANLTVLLYVKLVPGSWGRVGEAVCPVPDWGLPPSLNLHPMAMPIQLPASGTASGQLVYEIPGYYLDKLAEPPSARLELWDHVSDRRMTVPAEIGSHDRSRMIRSSGSAEILGPEYEAQPEQQDETAVSLHQHGTPEARPAPSEDEPALIHDKPSPGSGRPE